MALDFPSSPTEGQVFWPGGGRRSFIYRNGAWITYSGTAEPRNRFLNPAFQVSQVNGMTDGSNVGGLIMADEYYVYYATNGTYRGQRVLVDSKYRLRVSVTVDDPTLTSGDWLTIAGGGLEANKMVDFQYGTANAKYSIVRFGWKSPAGTYNFNLRNNGSTRSLNIPFTVSPANANTDMYFEFTIPPCYDGTWKNDNTYWAFAYFVICNFAMHSVKDQWVTGNYAGHTSMTNDFYYTIGNTVELWDIGFYRDPYVTGRAPVFVTPPIEQDITACQRYWYRLFQAKGVITAATTMRGGAVHPVPMRATPTPSIVSTPRIYDTNSTGAITAIANITHENSTVEFWANFTNSAGAYGVGRPGNFVNEGSTAWYLAMNARL